ncbi:MAG: type II secretion system F family protein [Nocardioidaceae bacterium]|nr:type II secretion system F family protein [Nocardioidaceae bacterium]
MIGALIGIGIASGVMLIIAGFTTTPSPSGRMKRRGSSGGGIAARFTATERTAALLALIVGIVLAAVLGWVVAIVLLPAAAVGAIRLMRPQKGVNPDHLEALEEWVRALRGILSSHASLTTAIISTQASTPQAIEPQVRLLVARLRSHTPLESALYSFAEDLDSQTGDYIAAALIQSSQFSGAGLSKALDAIAGEVATEVRALRDIEVDRSKPLNESRNIAIVAIVAALAIVFVLPFGAVYRDTGLGQAILLTLAAAFAADLYWLRARAALKPSPRFLTRPKEATR